MSPGQSRIVQGLAVLLLAVLAPACGGKSKGGPPKPTGVASVTVTTPGGVQKGVVAVSYLLADPGGITSIISVEYSINGGGAWQPATPAPAGDGTSELATSPGGVPHVFSWNSVANGVALGSAGKKRLDAQLRGGQVQCGSERRDCAQERQQLPVGGVQLEWYRDAAEFATLLETARIRLDLGQ